MGDKSITSWVTILWLILNSLVWGTHTRKTYHYLKLKAFEFLLTFYNVAMKFWKLIFDHAIVEHGLGLETIGEMFRFQFFAGIPNININILFCGLYSK